MTTLAATPAHSPPAQPWLLTGLLFLAYWLYLPFSGYAGLPYDAGKYWTLTERFFRQGHFELLAYDDSLRGYLLALLNLPAKAVVHFTGLAPLSVTRVMGAANAALLFGWAGPAVWRALFPAAPVSLAARLSFALLGFLFWRDYFNFPMSDFPAALALLVGLRLVLSAPAGGPLIGAGALLAAAVNIRPVYLAAVPLVLVMVVWLPRRGTWFRRAGAVAALALGFAVVSGPQLLMNGRYQQRWSPLVLSQDARFPAANLYLSQLGWGLVIQKYETSLDPTFPAPRMLYTDPAGQELLRQDAIHYFSSYTAYLRELVRRPGPFAALYGRHLFNGLDVQYASPYVRSIPHRQGLLTLLNYTVWFAALIGLVQVARSRASLRTWLILAALLAPALVTVPMAIECRFLLPLHLLLYGVFSFGVLPRLCVVAQWSGRKQLLVAGACLLFVVGCANLSAATRAHLGADLKVLEPLGSTAE